MIPVLSIMSNLTERGRDHGSQIFVGHCSDTAQHQAAWLADKTDSDAAGRGGVACGIAFRAGVSRLDRRDHAHQ